MIPIVLESYKENAFRGSVYISEIDDFWYYNCTIEDGIYDFIWNTNRNDVCFVCKHVIDIKCKGGLKDCYYADMIESLTEEFETKIIKKYKA